ncbi:hypothetical protein H6F67_24290 [Microcoleus sp. FACHB-1515]|uniref:hypothetical protein n=1 Tax=Cyanophyceae TaxID=3028117 RepID=UPI001685C4CC|nr:hypothetical protein [Microcoleus sp. FACHB-1515]MBD2092971.1 hypothetical protein [Microcoleus sp. FACHB-1515]
MARKIYLSDETLPESLQETLSQVAAQGSDRKDEVVEALSDEQPAKSRFVDSEYVACTWWEGCYYCQDDDKTWHRVKCFR